MRRIAILALGLVAACSDAEQAVITPTPPTAATAAPEIAPAPVIADAAAPVLLPDSEPAGAPFASQLTAAVAEVTQGGAVTTRRVYRASYEQARREINADNAHDRLRALENQIDLERQSLP